MLLEFDDLKKHRGLVAMVDGCFDPLHDGHIEYFLQAAALGLPLLCNLASDAYVSRKHVPFWSEAARARIIDALRYISFTHVTRNSTAAVLQELRPKAYVKGRDWRGRLPPEEMRVCQEFGIEVVYLDTVVDSSSRLLDRYVSNHLSRANMQTETFEEIVFSQSPVRASKYDQDYFTSEWRAGGNSYLLETRRRIEAKNPQLIKEVFNPQRVLDMGCGPGALMYLLHELGVGCDGIDFSPATRELAPPEVRDRIRIGAVTEPVVPDRCYDLVICREVLEHLTVLQVRRAVQNMCRASSRFVYVTTRFHPNPGSLLAVTTELEVDPTHITLMNKDLLRVLFVLEGFRSRPDLEKQLDWLNKGRVLVVERQPDYA